MPNTRLISLFAFLAVACAATIVHAELRKSNCACALTQPDAERKIQALLSKDSRGSRATILAIENLLRREPCAVAAVLAAAARVNREQALALEQAVVQAHAEMKVSDPAGAEAIQCLLDANKDDPVVAEILAAEGAQGSINGGAGGAGGGFVGGPVGQVSGH